jgi:hypothetical protein
VTSLEVLALAAFWMATWLTLLHGMPRIARLRQNRDA